MTHEHHTGTAAAEQMGRLRLVLALTVLYLVAEFIAGLLTGSLALLADAGHMLTDAGGLALALLAIRYAQRPATPARTYGYTRAEILAALTNAVVLAGISVFILVEAYDRFLDPPPIAGLPMLGVAVVGLAVNLAGMALLSAGARLSLNVKGAYLEVLSDTLSSLGVILAAVVIWTTGWRVADPLVSVGIGLFILPRAWTLGRDAVGILLEGTPPGIALADVRAALLGVEGVETVHDLHVWTLTAGQPVLTGHLVLRTGASPQEVLERARTGIGRTFGIRHVTLQLETRPLDEGEQHP